MGRKSKYQFHLQYKDSNYSKQSETNNELENKREKPRLTHQNQNRRGKNRNPLKKSLKEDTRDFSPINLKVFDGEDFTITIRPDIFPKFEILFEHTYHEYEVHAIINYNQFKKEV